MRESETTGRKMGERTCERVHRDNRDNIAVYLENVTTAYPRCTDPALKEVSLSIEEGSIALVTGPNGAGKTTLLELILGFLRPLVGTVRILGYRIPEHVRKVRLLSSYLMQDFMRGPNETYTVKQVVSMGLAPYKPPIRSLSDKEKKRVIEAIATVGLLGLEDRPIGTLSGGQQQRVFLARVLVRQPKLILLDEPFSSLDREGRIECSELINKIKTKLNTTIVVVSHDKKPILKYVDKIIEMENGRVARIK